MTQYHSSNVKLSYSQHNEIRSGIKNGAEVTLKLSSNVVGNYNYENVFPNNLLLNNTDDF